MAQPVAHDEVGLLGETLNHMTDQLRTKIDELSEDRAQLLAWQVAIERFLAERLRRMPPPADRVPRGEPEAGEVRWFGGIASAVRAANTHASPARKPPAMLHNTSMR